MKIYKIGRHYYKEILQDEHGEPKIPDNLEDGKVFALTDYDDEPIKYFFRTNKRGEMKWKSSD